MFDEIIKMKIQGKIFYMKESHFHQHPEVYEYLQDSLIKLMGEGRLENIGNVLKTSVDFGYPIGQSDCVKTEPEDDIFYAQRKGRKTFTRFVKNKEAPDCSTLSMVLAQGNKANRINVITAYVGYSAEKEPLDSSIKTKEDFDNSVAFWKNHALIENSQKVYFNTITTECPWDSFENRPVIQLGNHNNVTDIIRQLREKKKDIIDNYPTPKI